MRFPLAQGLECGLDDGRMAEPAKADDPGRVSHWDDGTETRYERSGAQWITEILRGGDAVLALASVGIEVRLGDLYEGIALPDAE